ncbi:LacI family DNA-binding transcriptional regulator [Carboxylicivirga sp. RSCT41]|uniref:LacI family DNA-binding transcriptional regulator n=1 Tax=Carboxylicivirga agarovorans TaxID=3417570 RepID=UPI003D32A484
MKKVSIKDIAKHLNISVPTVSLVLNGRGDEKRISKDTQDKIIKYAEEIHYKPNVFAKGLKKGKSEMLGLIIPNISDVFYAKIASRIEKNAAKHGYNVIFSSSEESSKKEKELIYSMLDRQVEGLIIASTQKNEKEILKLKEMNFPFVLIDRHYPELDCDHVIVDNKGGIARAVDHMFQMGARNIGYVSIKPDLDAIKMRLLGYKEAMEKSGLGYKPGNVQELNQDSYEEEMSRAFDKLLNETSPIDGVIFSTHYLTTAGLRELRKRHVKVPNDIKIISFDQFSAFDLLDPPVTVVTQSFYDIGDHAVDILLGKLQVRKNANTHKVLETGFIIRKSCGE